MNECVKRKGLDVLCFPSPIPSPSLSLPPRSLPARAPLPTPLLLPTQHRSQRLTQRRPFRHRHIFQRQSAHPVSIRPSSLFSFCFRLSSRSAVRACVEIDCEGAEGGGGVAEGARGTECAGGGGGGGEEGGVELGGGGGVSGGSDGEER